jgi:hypothetical protein
MSKRVALVEGSTHLSPPGRLFPALGFSGPLFVEEGSTCSASSSKRVAPVPGPRAPGPGPGGPKSASIFEVIILDVPNTLAELGS